MADRSDLHDHFLEDFVEHPTAQEVETQYRWIPAEHPRVTTTWQYDTPKIQETYFRPLLEKYFNAVGNAVPSKVSERFISLATQYANLRLDRGESYRNPEGAVQNSRLRALMLQPEFLASDWSLPFMIELKDLEGDYPWEFEMWERYDEIHGYQSAPEWNTDHIYGLARFVEEDQLWEGQNEEVRRVFFTSVAHALQRMSRDFPLDTVAPRIQILQKNGEEHHGPWCRGAFREYEIDALKAMSMNSNFAKHEYQLKLGLGLIDADESLRFSDHMC